ncbi:MAG: type III pantothenate kinase [Muribaculaceae bacterium]|nr:type III pantothenate kinase [Muribaculaceae bacterium]
MIGNLTIDNGNTSVKVAFFIGNQIVATTRFVRRDTRLLERFISTYKPETAIVCSTASSAASQRIETLAEQRCRNVMYLSHDTPMPITLGYRTPMTLGRDRIATAVGAWSISQRLDEDNDVLIIDAGTAITYDLVTARGCFVGGNIAPGMTLRFKSLHEHTGRLPLVQADGDTPVVGYDTLTAIRSGVMLGILGEIRSYIADIKLSHPNLTVFITGGDGKLLQSHLGDKDVIYYENLAAEGLNRIYLYNQANETL